MLPSQIPSGASSGKEGIVLSKKKYSGGSWGGGRVKENTRGGAGRSERQSGPPPAFKVRGRTSCGIKRKRAFTFQKSVESCRSGNLLGDSVRKKEPTRQVFLDRVSSAQPRGQGELRVFASS